jgi:Secretion system C-terminal sorting domain
MKNLYYSVLTFLFLVVAQAQIVNIPDANFKAKLLSASPNNQFASTQTPVYNSSNNYWTVSSYHKIDTNNDGEIQVSEAQTIKYLDPYFSSISNLEGIESFTNIVFLRCGQNNLTSLNVQGLTNLQCLICNNNALPSINVQGLTNLKTLICGYNQFPSLNVQGLANLQSLYCDNNQLTALFIKNNNVNWRALNFYNNPNLSFICADDEDLTLVQQKVDVLGYTNCQIDSNCSLSVVNNHLENNYFSIYPNPVKNELNLSTKQAITIYSLSIYNTLGQLVQTITNPEKTIDVAGLKTGNYIMKVTTDKGVSSSKFVKK